MSKSTVWLIGAGIMALDYAKVLEKLEQDFITVGRGEINARIFEEKTGKKVIIGGLDSFLATKPILPTAVIISTGIETLAETTIKLLQYGVKKILLEKPGVAYPNEMEELLQVAQHQKATVALAYNRRFYAATQKAQEIIVADGGVISFHFEFTEWSHSIATLNKTKEEFQNWFLGNSSHVIDLAFYLGGQPTIMQSFVKGQSELAWHEKSAIFTGAGETEQGALFSYMANWLAPGRWSVEMLTRKHRLIFRPMEKLQIQKIGSVAIEMVENDYSLDESFKPGLFLQTKAFLDNDYTKFCMLEEQAQKMQLYKKISNY
jgi:predicted dehydrogenase